MEKAINMYVNVIILTKPIVSCENKMKVVKSEQKKSFWRCKTMCYLIAKKFNDMGCIALQTTHGRHLADFKWERAFSRGF